MTDILPDLCRMCRKIPGWYSNMPGYSPGFASYFGYSEMPELMQEALVVETAARGHLKCLRAALSASAGQYECIDGVMRGLEPGDQPLLHFETGLLYGPSALMAAAWNGHPRCVKLLIKEKFIMCVEAGEPGTTPICLAIKGGNRECFNLLFKAHRKENSMFRAFENAIEHGFEGCVRMLIAAGADINQVDESGRSLLMYWNPSDDVAITKALIDAGVDPNIESDEDGTALTTHIEGDSFKSVCVLLDAGADVNATNDNPTPLMYAVDGYMKHKWSFVVALLLKGAKINITENSEVNPLTHSLMEREPNVDHKTQNILFAAGEKIDIQAVEANGNTVPKHLQPQFNLMDICRRRIREHLLKLEPHTHLFGRIPMLGLPSIMTDYLLYDQKLDDTEYMQILSRVDNDEFNLEDYFDDDDYFFGFEADEYDSSDDQDVSSDEDIDDNNENDDNDNDNNGVNNVDDDFGSSHG